MTRKRADTIREQFYTSRFPYPTHNALSKEHKCSPALIRAVLRSDVFPSKNSTHWYLQAPLDGPLKWGPLKVKQVAGLTRDGFTPGRIAEIVGRTSEAVSEMVKNAKERKML